jgi:hypothetical protein
MEEAVSAFRAVAGLVPSGWGGVLAMVVALPGSDQLLVGRPPAGEIAPDLVRAPSVRVYSPEYFSCLPPPSGEDYRWVCDEDPWGLSDEATEVTLVSGRRTDSDRVPRYRNVVAFTRYCGLGSPVGSARSTPGARGGGNRGGSGSAGDPGRSVNKMQQEIRRGIAPAGIKRVEKAIEEKCGDHNQDHVHFENDAALNQGRRRRHGKARRTRR